MVVLLIWQLCGKNNRVTSGVVAALIPIEVIVRARTLAFSLSTSKPTVGQHAEQLVPPLTVKKKGGKTRNYTKVIIKGKQENQACSLVFSWFTHVTLLTSCEMWWQQFAREKKKKARCNSCNREQFHFSRRHVFSTMEIVWTTNHATWPGASQRRRCCTVALECRPLRLIKDALPFELLWYLAICFSYAKQKKGFLYVVRHLVKMLKQRRRKEKEHTLHEQKQQAMQWQCLKSNSQYWSTRAIQVLGLN